MRSLHPSNPDTLSESPDLPQPVETSRKEGDCCR